jgi:hypothetical protein
LQRFEKSPAAVEDGRRKCYGLKFLDWSGAHVAPPSLVSLSRRRAFAVQRRHLCGRVALIGDGTAGAVASILTSCAADSTRSRADRASASRENVRIGKQLEFGRPQAMLNMLGARRATLDRSGGVELVGLLASWA